jgi:2-polyprenyl-3-methyl-5-hydroxy-6-metoxy-1,4-benzoquinol methylase
MIDNSVIFFGKREVQFYKNLIIRAHHNLHEDVARRITNLGLSKAKILDLGCGQGAMSLRLKDLGYEVLAVDMNVDDYMAEDVPFVSVNFNDAKDLAGFVEDYRESFDIVLGLEVIEHVENQWEYVRLLKSMVKKGGYILLSTPNITSWMSRLIFLFFGKFHQFDAPDLEYGHISPISPWHLEVIIKEEDLELIDIEPVGTLPAFYIESLSKSSLVFNALNLLFYPFMRGVKTGWSILATMKKN